MSDIQNPVLRDAEDEVEAQLEPGQRHEYLGIVVFGMKTAQRDDMAGIWCSLRNTADPIRGCAQTAIELCLKYQDQSEDAPSPRVMLLAGQCLMIQALDLMHTGLVVDVREPQLLQARRDFKDILSESIGHIPQMRGMTAAMLGGTHGV